jgi:predicted MFS family arabinose efflux permease
LGRVVAGVGGAGINCLVSIVIAGESYPPRSRIFLNIFADLVPIREVASWRSYVNIAATTGRSLGGPIGGYLTDTIGWRW